MPLLLKTKDAAGTPTEPQDAPKIVVWSGATPVFEGEMPVIERETRPGTFFRSLFLGPDYAVGQYLVDYRWVLAGGYIGQDSTTFEVLPGGNTDGAVVSAYFYSRPHADFTVHQTERGTVLPGKNPSL